MRIAISGKSGCGNTTVSSLVSKELGYPMINFTFRNLAEERGMDFWDLAALAEKDDSIDFELDRRQVEMALAREDCVLGSRLAIWMLKEADLKIYLDATVEERRGDPKRRNPRKRSRNNRPRRQDTARYKRLYDIDNTDSTVADLIDRQEKVRLKSHIIVMRF